MQDTLQHETHQARILIVDDEATNLKLLERMLARQGYNRLVCVQDPRQVLEAYQSERTDLILLDINMPHLDGYAVLDQLQALSDPLLPPVVFLTAQTGRDYVLRALSSGARDFISKPFDRNELLARVRNLLEAQIAHRLLHNQKAMLEEMVRERTDALRNTRLQVVQRLGRAAEYRDNETGYHIMRMSRITALLAGHLGFDETQCELILHASPMHDIGKIGIPDHILQKPGRLTEEEFELMKSHTTVGGELLGGDDSDLMCMAREIALTHHEKWDGSGYPNGLAEEAIPLTGRICAVADVFDALTSERPYKQAWPIERAVDLIREQNAIHFDPRVVDCFLDHLDEIIHIRNCYAEPVQ